MKSKIWSIFGVLVVVLVISSTGLYAQRFEGRGVMWLTEVIEEPYTEEELDEIFDKKNLELAKNILEGNVSEIAKYFRNRSHVKKPNGEKIRGGSAIAAYLQSLNANIIPTKEKQITFVLVYSYKIEIDVDIDEYYKQEQNEEDSVYPIVEHIKIILDVVNNSPMTIEGLISYEHPRKTFRNGG